MGNEELLELLNRTGAVELASLTDEELESVRADDGTPFRPGQPPEILRTLREDTRRAVLTTALRSLVVRGLVAQPSDEELARSANGGQLHLQALDDLDSILAIRRAPASVVFVGQASYLAAMHRFVEGEATGWLEERIDGRGFHHFTLRTVDNAVEALVHVADPGRTTPTDAAASGQPQRDIPEELARPLRELAPGVTRIDAYHTRPEGTRRMQVSIVVGQGETSVVRSAFGVAPTPPQVVTVNDQGLRAALGGVLRDEDDAAVQPDEPDQEQPVDEPVAGSPRYTCPVCGYPNLDEPPYSDTDGASYDICPSCGFEFGYDDEAQGITHEQWRQRWIDGGMKWSSRGRRQPPGWDPRAQLATLTKV